MRFFELPFSSVSLTERVTEDSAMMMPYLRTLYTWVRNSNDLTRIAHGLVFRGEWLDIESLQNRTSEVQANRVTMFHLEEQSTNLLPHP